MGSTYKITPPLNIDGLPMRPGAKKCLYYLRCRECRYGVDCVYDHPNPPYKPKPRRMAYDNHTAASSSSSSSSRGGISYPCTSYQNDNYSFYNVAIANGLPQTHTGMHSQWLFPVQASTYMPAGQNVMMPVLNSVPVAAEEITEPEQYICAHMMKTGECRFGSACRFHHPRNWVIRRNDCQLNNKGLPLRPEKAVCQHYGSFGLCKSGPACLFDHPPVQHTCSNTNEGEGSSSLTKQDEKTQGKLIGSWLSTCFPDYKGKSSD